MYPGGGPSSSKKVPVATGTKKGDPRGFAGPEPVRIALDREAGALYPIERSFNSTSWFDATRPASRTGTSKLGVKPA
jgi:hypothetical protein